MNLLYRLVLAFFALNIALTFPAATLHAEEMAMAAVPDSSNDFPPIQESKAFQQFILKPVSELSKLIYLIDRFGESKIEVQYEDHYYAAPFVGRFVRMFLAAHYAQQSADYWLSEHAVTSMHSGKLIWLKFPDGSFKLAREVFANELKALDQTVKEYRKAHSPR